MTLLLSAWLKFVATWFKENWKPVIGVIIGLLIIGAFFFLVKSLHESGKEIGQLETTLTTERETREAIEADYKRLIKLMEKENENSQRTATIAENLTKDIENESPQDRPVGPVLRRTIDSLRNAESASQN